jgi:hypothetical protein
MPQKTTFAPNINITPLNVTAPTFFLTSFKNKKPAAGIPAAGF